MQIGLGMLLFIVFMILKLTHTIDWSWWWITAPLWGGFVLYLVFVLPFQLYAASQVRKAHRSIARDFRWR